VTQATIIGYHMRQTEPPLEWQKRFGQRPYR
jgi:hypothetical protein